MKPLRFLAPAVLISSLLAVAGGCEEEEPVEEQNVAETKALFGDDRVADVLKGHLDKVPRNFKEFEKLFKVGRECERTDSKEIFVVEESSSRATGEQHETDMLLPRSIVTGCNTGEGNPESEPSYMSYSLMAAIFSSPDVAGAENGDPMVFDRVEVMALDRKTGLYNFYVMTPSSDKKKPGILQRVQLRPDGDVYTYTKDPTKKRMVTKKSADALCHNCHVNMGPLMNEMHEPWTNWVSTHKTLPDSASELSGETLSIVNESVAIDGSHGRLSLANDLEKTMTAAIRVWNEGPTESPEMGFIQANIDGDQPQGVDGLLQSVFCETELQYATTFSTVPLELFIDPGAVAGGGFLPPAAYSSEKFPVLMPVRSDMDKRIELALVKKKVLQLRTVQAIRLIDDKNDVFSSARCGLYPTVVAELPEDITQIDAHVRKIVRDKAASLVPAGPRQDYLNALLLDIQSPELTKTAKAAYMAEAKTALMADVAKLQTKAGRDELKTRSQARKDAARNMFDREANPMPILPDEKKGT